MRVVNELTVHGREIADMPAANAPGALREFEVSVHEAERLINRAKGRSFFVYCKWHARAIDQSRAEPGKVSGYHVSGNVKCSKREALGFLKNAFTENTRELVFIRVTFNDRCFFIGS